MGWVRRGFWGWAGRVLAVAGVAVSSVFVGVAQATPVAAPTVQEMTEAATDKLYPGMTSTVGILAGLTILFWVTNLILARFKGKRIG